MDSAKYLNISLQEKMPEHVIRTEHDVLTSDSDEGGTPSENEDEINDYDEEKVEMEEEEEESESEKNSENRNWADAMAKILKTNTPKGKKTIVLAKARKLGDVVAAQKGSGIAFEIDGEIKEEKPDPDSQKVKIEEKDQLLKTKKREWDQKARIKPSILEKNREKALGKTATKGVVQLFNTVREHQKKINKKLNEAGSERKREKVLKSVDKQSFLDMLMGPTVAKTTSNTSCEAEPEIKEEDKASWEALRADFMTRASLKDWDKKMEFSKDQQENKEKKKKEKMNIVDSDEEDDGGMSCDSYDASDDESNDES